MLVDVKLDSTQQRICVNDNAGGLDKEELPVIVSPGLTRNKDTANTIGIFGVGSKRAVVALAQDVTIRTRKSEKTYEISFNDEWIEEDDDWSLDVFEVNQISEGTTEIELLKLRHPINEEIINYLANYLGATYALLLLDQDIEIQLNDKKIEGISFENWAYPPKFEPIEYKGEIQTDDGNTVLIEAIGGLILQSSPSGGEYGVYFYCNDRLIAKALKTYDVGFYKGLAGKPHADISIMRLIIRLNGPASLMPWNSSKSGINPSTQVFAAIRNWLLAVVKDYTSLARKMSKMEGGWPENVFKFTEGEKMKVNIDNFPTVKTSYLPPLPIVTPLYSKVIKQKNQPIADIKPWTKGLFETIIVVKWILKQNFEQKNRISLILLDSDLEIAFKEFLVNESGASYSNNKLVSLFGNRHDVEKEIQKYSQISQNTWQQLNYYYNMRCLLIHQKASVNVSNSDIDKFFLLVTNVLHALFGLEF